MKAMGLEEGIKLNGFYLSSIVGDSGDATFATG